MPERPEDTGLLAALAQALSGDTPAPPPEGLAALHAAVDRRSLGQTDPQPARPFGWARAPLANLRWRRPAGVVAIMTGSLVAGGGVAFASGAPVPPPIRELATHLGLPVTPQPVVNVHNTESRLSKALQEVPTSSGGVTGTINSSISHFAGTLRQQVSELTPAQRQNEDPKAQHLLEQAARQDDQGSHGNQGRDGKGHSDSGHNQNNQGQGQDNHPGTQHSSTGGNDHSGGSGSSGNQNEQGAGGSGGVHFYTTGAHFNRTSAAVRQAAGDDHDNH